ncbi:hypothetical protein BT96DRAFT_986429 [Gymnopus androsaceus JB14]|uniref:P-loop containing nucleoside triphosphate hydrolase protein n=1 Tax=Gymnopus androsaceus JB14 TaxID=1447944 RepID=A0A6A4IAW1_9AGAR|nr:hypothetical protein BT96DRAFT_986429 [Gymnopus androsaceus JB14]
MRISKDTGLNVGFPSTVVVDARCGQVAGYSGSSVTAQLQIAVAWIEKVGGRLRRCRQFLRWCVISSIIILMSPALFHKVLSRQTYLGRSLFYSLSTIHRDQSPAVAVIFAAWPYSHCQSSKYLFRGRPSAVDRQSKDLILCLVFAYTTILSVSALLLLHNHRRWSIVHKRHVNTILFVALVVYVVRDVYPLVTYSKHPLDASHNAAAVLLWTKIILLLLDGGVQYHCLFLSFSHAHTRYVHYRSHESEISTSIGPNPEQLASPLSLLLFAFLEHVVWKAYRVDHLPATELPHLADSDRVGWLKKKWFPSLERYSSAYASASSGPQKDTKHKPSRKMPYTLVWIFRWTWLNMAVAMLSLAAGNLGSPLAINRLLFYLETNFSSSSDTETSPSSDADIRPWFWVIILFLSPITVALSMEWYLRIVLRLNVHLDALLTQLVFEHSLRIRVKADPDSVSSAKSSPNAQSPESSKKGGKSPSGRINNLVTTDLANISELRNWVLIFFQRPLEFVLSVVFLYNILGWSTFVGIGLMIALAPIPMKLINAGRKLFLERMKKTDVRVGVFTDVMSSLRMVKLFGWAGKMSRRISDVREEELRYLKKRRMFLMFSNLVNYIVPLVSVTGCFATFVCSSSTLIMKQDLTPSRVFSTLVVFERLQLHVRFMFVNLNRYYAGLISIGRIEEFLGETELIDAFDSLSASLASTVVAEDEDEDQLIGFNNATFSWSKKDEEDYEKAATATSTSTFSDAVTVAPAAAVLEETETKLEPGPVSVDDAALPTPQAQALQIRKFFLTIIDKVLFHRNSINLIIGPTGSGKTAMLLALLGEMHYIPMITLAGDNSEAAASGSGSKGSWFNLPRGSGGVAYAAQESWVQNETIRDNILFHSPFDQDRYDKVIYQCGLERDLALFDAGDLTEVGEKGLTLSGGQKARLTLARAVYSKAKVLLLDDVLAALDVHTSKWIVEKCFLGDLMNDRTVILVTHNTALTLPIARFVVTLKDGRVASQEVVRNASTEPEAEAQIEKAAATIDEEEALESEVNDEPALKKKDSVVSGKLVMDEEVQVGHVSWSAIKLYATGLGGRFPVLFFAAWLGGSILAQLTMVFQTWYLGFWASQYEGREPGDVPVALYLAGYGGIVLLTVLINCFTTLNYIYGVIRASEHIHKRLVASILGTTMRWLDKTPVSRIITRATQDINAVDISLVSSLNAFFEVCIRLLSRLAAVVLFSPVFVLPGMLLLVIGVSCGSVYFKAQMSVKREMSIAKAPVLGHFGATIAGLTSIRAYGAQKISIIEMQTRTDRHSRIARIFNNLQRWMAVRINILSAVFTASLAWYLVYVLRQSASVTGFTLNMAVSFSSAIFGFVLEFNALEARSNRRGLSFLERIDNYLNIEQEAKPSSSGEPPAYWPASGDLRVEGLSAKYSSDGPEVLHQLAFHVKSGERIGVVGRTGSGKSSLALSLLRCIHTSGDIFYDGLSINKINLEALRSKITIIPQIPELISGSLRENLDPFQEHDDLTLNDALKSAGLQTLQEDMSEKDKIKLDTMVSSGGSNFSLGQRQIIALARAIVRRSKLLILDEAIMDADRIMVLDAGSIVEFDTPLALLSNKEGRLRALVDQSHDKDVLIEMAEKKLG